MARLWSSGFELQTLTDFVEFTDGGGASCSINTTTKRSGAASLRVNTSSSSDYVQNKIRASGTSALYFRFYLRIATAPSADTTIGVLTNDAVSSSISLILKTDRTLQHSYYDGADTTNVGSPSSALSLNTWYRIEISYDDATGGNPTTARLDGVQFASGNSIDVGVTTLWVGVVDSATADLYFDDIAINDSSGSTQTSFPGAGSIVHMQPDSAGDNNNASSGDYSSVDEVTPDNSTTIAVLNDDNDILDVNMETSSNAGIGASDTITLVQVGSRDAAASAAEESFKLRIKSQSSGTLLQSGTITHNDTTYKTVGQGEGGFWGYQLTSYTDPQAGGAWTTSLLDTAQIGIQAIDATPDINVTTLWALVEYVPNVAGTTGKEDWPILTGSKFWGWRYS